MSKRKKPFIDLCLEGAADLSEVDDYIESWHLSAEDIPIHEYLGMKQNEYAIWVEKPQAIRFILFSRRYDIPIKEAFTQMAELPLAARASDTEEIDGVLKWLKRTGRI